MLEDLLKKNLKGVHLIDGFLDERMFQKVLSILEVSVDLGSLNNIANNFAFTV